MQETKDWLYYAQFGLELTVHTAGFAGGVIFTKLLYTASNGAFMYPLWLS